MKRAFFIVSVIAVSIWAAMTLTSTRNAAEASATTRQGGAIDISADPGAPMTIVHFWGTWCGPCREELPDFVAFQRDQTKSGITFIAVADDPDFATVDRYLSDSGIDLASFVLDPRGDVARAWGVDAYPSTFVLGPNNEILAAYRGMVDWASPLERREILRLGGLEP